MIDEKLSCQSIITMNNDSNKLDNFKQQYKEIFIILDRFMDYYQNEKKEKSKKPCLDKYSELFVLFYFVLFSYSVLVLYFKDFWKNNPNFLIIISIVILVVIALIAITSIMLLFQEITNSKKSPNILLKNTYQINNLIPFFALGLTAFTIYQYKPENLDVFNFIKNIIVISSVMTIILKAVTELIDNKTIYQKCLSIVQYAKVLVDQSQPKDIKYLPANKQKNKNIMTALRKNTINQPSEFDHNS